MLHCAHFDVKGGKRTFAAPHTKTCYADQSDINDIRSPAWKVCPEMDIAAP